MVLITSTDLSRCIVNNYQCLQNCCNYKPAHSRALDGHLTLCFLALKGLGHAILGNFSTDQMVIELAKVSK